MAAVKSAPMKLSSAMKSSLVRLPGSFEDPKPLGINAKTAQALTDRGLCSINKKGQVKSTAKGRKVATTAL
jgi:hypothetical protein